MPIRITTDPDHVLKDGRLAPLPITTPAAYLHESGRTYMSSSGRITLALAGNIRATIDNPAGSARNMLLSKLTGLVTVTAWATVRRNPTTGLPVTAARPILNGIVVMPAGVGVLKADTHATESLGGGADTGLVIGLPATRRFELNFATPLLLPPGEVLGITIPFTAGADAVFTAYWGETDA